MIFAIPRRGLSPIFIEIHEPDPYKVEVIKNIDTDIIIDPLYLKHTEDLYVLSYMTGDRPWDILCRVDKILESEEMQCRIHDMAAITGTSTVRISNAFRRLLMVDHNF